MNQLSGLSYGHSIASPHRYRCKRVWDSRALACVLEFVHPGNLGELPPDPYVIACKACLMGLGKHDEFRKTVWY
jgi:hypothetical protein